MLDPAQDLILRPISSVQTWVAMRYAAIRDLLKSPSDLAELRAQNAELELEIAQLQQEIISLQEQVAESQILSALLNYARSEPENRYLAANIIGKDTSPFIRSVWMDRGSDVGIKQGMPVVTERGLVGRVAEVFATSARVQLITDPEIIVNVRLQNSRSDGALAPQLSGEIWVDLIDQDIDVSPGELVLTSGLGGIYPADIPVGEVISVRKRDYELFQQVVIQPSVDVDDLEIVLIITNFRPLTTEANP
ncbi:MAG: rod shape-determining protein MreC [Chloroflexi bacterium RBG_16_48_8]|nr:MAG: rod shape-determining protein MreC [Chloroflexi bacterium RBG_16_48_8]